jgi:hypothetical protein
MLPDGQALSFIPFSAMDILFWSVHCVLLTGLFVHIFSDTEFNQPVTEPWMRSVYPIGILFTIGSYLLIASFNWFFIRQTGIWWASLASFVIAVFFLWGVYIGFRKNDIRTSSIGFEF